jgi:hypothetical protein
MEILSADCNDIDDNNSSNNKPILHNYFFTLSFTTPSVASLCSVDFEGDTLKLGLGWKWTSLVDVFSRNLRVGTE